MSELLSKLSTYNIFNYLFPGILFVVEFENIIGIKISQNDTIKDIAIYYFIGFLVSRLGSIFIEPFMKKIKLVKFSEYKDFLSASKNDDKISDMSEINNMLRTLLSVHVVVLFMYLFKMLNIGWKTENYTWIALILMIVVFALSYTKQVGYIRERVENSK